MPLDRAQAQELAAVWSKDRPWSEGRDALIAFAESGRITTGLQRFRITAFLDTVAMPAAFELLQCDPGSAAFMNDLEQITQLHQYVLYALLEPLPQKAAA